jgi:uncharacterized sulfatase
MRTLLSVFAPFCFAATAAPPNVILIVADDLGFGDLGAFGATRIKTPHLDAIAARGAALTGFYAAANICSPSRAAILTGRYPIRSGLGWDVVTAEDKHGLPLSEITIAELLKKRGYETAMVGKWHLGNQLEYWPTRQGFDSFYGVPHSNDMPNFALYRGEEQIEQPVDQSTLTARYTEEAVKFIRRNAQKPFFLYLAHTFPHIPLYASERFRGKSAAGLYGDTVEEIDWSTGEVVKVLQELNLLDNTLILFTSDNGAWWEGSNGPFRGAKGSTWDAGYRVGLVASLPGRIKTGLRSDALAANIDLLPTIAAVTGTPLPAGLELDGKNLLPLLRGDDMTSPHDYFYYFNNEELAGIRDARWKLLTRAYYRRHLGAMDLFDDLPEFTEPYWLLFDMHDEQPERYSLARDNPAIVERLAAEMARAETEFRRHATRSRQQTYPAQADDN